MLKKLPAYPLSLVLLLPQIFCVAAHAQTYSVPDNKLSLNAAVVLSKEFCATKPKKGIWGINQETFEIGKAACAEIEPALRAIFTTLTRVEEVPTSGDAQVILVPRVVDITATQPKLAFSNRDLVVEVEWTAKDKSGKSIWVDTVQGTGTHHVGNSFTYKKNLKLILNDTAKDLAQKSATGMLASPELGKLAAGALSADGGH